MPQKPVIQLFSPGDICAYGKDILRIRYQNDLTRKKVCAIMNSNGFEYYQMKLLRYERCPQFCLPGGEMTCLIKAIQANFNVKV